MKLEDVKTEKVFVQFDDNWADEMDIEEFSIENTEEFKKSLQELKDYMDAGNSVYKYFGSNEDNEYETFKDYERTLSYDEVTEDEIKTINKFFGSGDFYLPEYDD
jgi:hypothetical protein